EAGTVTLFKAILEFVPEIDDEGHVHFEEVVDMGAGTARFDHALRDDLAHLGHGNNFARNWRRSGGLGWSGRRGTRRGLRRRTCRAFFDEGHDVLLGDSAAHTRALNTGEIDAFITSQAAHQR